MILKKVFNPIRVIQYMWVDILFSAGLALVVFYLHSVMGWVKLGLPFSVAAILGSALAIFIAFRNNTAYSRWWEARTLWGGIVNSSRVFARLIKTFTDSHRSQQNFDKSRSEAFKRELIYMQIAWSHALRYHLRREDNWRELKSLLNDDDFSRLMQSQNKPNFLQLLMGEKIYNAMSNGTLGGFDSFQIEGQLLALANYQGGCERIKNTPLLRQYHFFTKLFLLVFMTVLPFSLIPDFAKNEMAWMVIPISILISFVFGVMGKVGEVNEDPFDRKVTDVPLTSLCSVIERDLRETLGEQDLPKPVLPENGYLN